MSFKPDMPDIKAEYRRGYDKGFTDAQILSLVILTALTLIRLLS